MVRVLFAVLTLCTGWLPAWVHPATAVEVVAVIEGLVQEDVALIGSVVPRRSARISAQVAGLVAAIHVDEGHQVNAHEALFELDAELAQIDVQRALAQVAQADAERGESQRKLSETQRLHREGHVPLSTLESAQSDAAVQEALNAQRRADLSRAQILLAQHQISAPFAGTIVGKEAEVGQWIGTDSTVLVLAQTNPVRVEVPLPQHLFDRVKQGTTARIQFQSLPNEIYDATVTNRIPLSRDGARTFPIWLELPNETFRLAPGMSAQVNLVVEQSHDPALLVPDDALVRRADGSTLLWVVREAGDVSKIVEPVLVLAGRTHSGMREIEGKGLSIGDIVVVRGNENLRPGQAVQILGGE